ncbi:hypothetical protein M0P48_01040 [Candidatus Gracilibacteria bacterium]|jgi:hypothetical protein|nr:hypothetical protein [Candidatus Gracilibacteria bacterium]
MAPNEGREQVPSEETIPRGEPVPPRKPLQEMRIVNGALNTLSSAGLGQLPDCGITPEEIQKAEQVLANEGVTSQEEILRLVRRWERKNLTSF